jgi:hypothetical protein
VKNFNQVHVVTPGRRSPGYLFGSLAEAFLFLEKRHVLRSMFLL